MAYISYASGIPGQNCRTYGVVPSLDNADVREGEVVVLNPYEGKCRISSDGLSAEPWVDELLQLQDETWLKAKQVRLSKQYAGVDTPYGRVDTKITQVSNSPLNIGRAALSASVAIATGDTDWSKNWTMADNSEQTLTAAQMLEIDSIVTAYIDACQQASIPIRTAIYAATTIAELEEVDLSAGYP